MSDTTLHKINVEDIYENLDGDENAEEDNFIVIDLSQIQWIDAIVRYPDQFHRLMFTIHFVLGGDKTLEVSDEDYHYRIRDEYRKLVRAWEDYKKYI